MVKMKYENSKGTTVELRNEAIISSYYAFKNYTLNYENDVLADASRTVSIPVVCTSKEAANTLIAVLEYDSAKNKAGKLFLDEWYLQALFTGFSIVLENDNFIKLNVSFYLPQSIFTKETEHALFPKGEEATGGVGFPYDFPYDFGIEAVSTDTISNSELLDADFILRFSADVQSVSISIGDRLYSVDAALKAEETFTLDTAEKEVYRLSNGGKASLFGLSSDASYIFEPIPQGTHTVQWSGDFPLYITLLEHRRTPPWT